MHDVIQVEQKHTVSCKNSHMYTTQDIDFAQYKTMGPQKQSIALSKRLSAKFAKTANDRNCAFLTTNKKERFAVIWQNMFFL